MATERYVRSFDGTELFTTAEGDGPVLVLSDGLGCDGFVWRHLRPAFASRYRILHWHYRGHGLSQAPKNPSGVGVEDLVGDLLAVLDAWDVDQAVLLGHSMGVQVILEFGVQHPERVLGLVPLCGSYGRPLDTFHDSDLASALLPRALDLIRRFPGRAQFLWSSLLPTELSYQIGVHFELNHKLVRRPDFEPYLEHLASMDIQVFMRMLEALNRHSVEDRLHELHTPTLIVAGENDTFTPAWLSQRMHQLIPDSELLMIPSGTHAAPIELPELVHLRLDRFLEQRVFGAAAGIETRAAAKASAASTAAPKKARKSKGAAKKRAPAAAKTSKSAADKGNGAKSGRAGKKKTGTRRAAGREATLEG